jgi:hypothetical protein
LSGEDDAVERALSGRGIDFLGEVNGVAVEFGLIESDISPSTSSIQASTPILHHPTSSLQYDTSLLQLY